jgi:hypothetical protein
MTQRCYADGATLQGIVNGHRTTPIQRKARRPACGDDVADVRHHPA